LKIGENIHTRISTRRGAFPIVLLFGILFSPDLYSQLVLSGDFNLKGQRLVVNNDRSDTLRKRLYGLNASIDLNLDYRHRRLSTYVDLFISGAYQQFQSIKYVNGGLNLYQGWLQYRFADWFALKGGRVELGYDDERFFEARDWSNLVSSHNILIGQFVTSDTTYRADIGFAVNNFVAASILNTAPSLNSYSYMYYLFQHVAFLEGNSGITLLCMADANRMNLDPGMPLYTRYTGGGNVWFDLEPWNIFLTGYYQGGHITDGRKISAWYYSSYVCFQAAKRLKFMLTFEHLSGDDLSDTNEMKTTVHGFSMLYGNKRERFGWAGLMNSGILSNISPGLDHLYVKGFVDILTGKLSMDLTWHWFALPHSFVNSVKKTQGDVNYTNVTRKIADEFDLEIDYNPLPVLELKAQYSLVLPTGTLQRLNNWNLGGQQTLNYASLEFDYTPTFHHSKK
jgi:hypothetical protein